MKLKIARVATVPLFFTQIKEQIRYFCELGHEVTIITSYDSDFEDLLVYTNAKIKYITISREINLFKDLVSLFLLTIHFFINRYDIVHTSTPKAGLLGSVAAFTSFTPTRIHTFTGQRWVTLDGAKKKLLVFLDKVIGFLNTHNYSDSTSQNNFLISSKIVHKKNISIIGKGSLAGIDLQRFDLEKTLPQATSKMKNLNLDLDKFTFLFVGRKVKDKGIEELVQAFKIFQKDTDSQGQLLLVGPFESGDPISEKTHSDINDDLLITDLGFQDRPEDFMAIADVFCLPSYREGFGTVVLEAASLGTPSIGTKIVGLEDAIVNNVTGLLVKPKSVKELSDAMKYLFINREKLCLFGKNGKKRAHKDFGHKLLADKQLESYFNLSESTS
jgi:glycosyltransferase involved in cell wall biosynthesis